MRVVAERFLNNKTKCAICKCELKNFIALAKHIAHRHCLSSKDYFDNYLKKEKMGHCVVCGNTTRFITLGEGYSKTCSLLCYSQNQKGKNNHFFGKTHSAESRRLIGIKSIGRPISALCGNKISIRVKNYRKNHWWTNKSKTGQHLSEETKNKIRIKAIGRKWSIASKNKMLQAMLKSVCARPNKFESVVAAMLNEKFPNRFKYTGDGSFTVNGKSADFLDKDNKIIVLANGIYWHLLRFGLKNTPKTKRSIEIKEARPFIINGFTVWHIWEDAITKIIINKHKTTKGIRKRFPVSL